jgi:hypothetical protein
MWIFAAATAVLVAGLSCGDSDDTPLGSEFIDDLLGSRPGEVFEDTFAVGSGDTSYAFPWLIDEQSYLEVGRGDGYQRTILMRTDFSSAGNDALKTVERANLRLIKIEFEEYVDDITARFYQLGTEYNEGDSIVVLDTTFVIPDTSGAIDRTLQLFPPNYTLPPDLVQSWIRGEVPPNGIAIVYPDTLDEVFGVYSRTTDDAPRLEVLYTDQTQTNFSIVADGIFVRPTTTTQNLVVSDGFVRRVFLPVDLSAVDDSAAVHDARLILTIVPETVFGTNQQVVLYAPESSDPSSKDFATGTLIDQETLEESTGTLELTITNVLLLFLSGELDNNGFALRFTGEKSEVRQAEFYPSSHPTLGPKIGITYSTPADFED